MVMNKKNIFILFLIVFYQSSEYTMEETSDPRLLVRSINGIGHELESEKIRAKFHYWLLEKLTSHKKKLLYAAISMINTYQEHFTTCLSELILTKNYNQTKLQEKFTEYYLLYIQKQNKYCDQIEALYSSDLSILQPNNMYIRSIQKSIEALDKEQYDVYLKCISSLTEERHSRWTPILVENIKPKYQYFIEKFNNLEQSKLNMYKELYRVEIYRPTLRAICLKEFHQACPRYIKHIERLSTPNITIDITVLDNQMNIEDNNLNNSA